MYRVHKVEVIKLNLIWIKFYCRINFERHDWNFDIIISFDMQRAECIFIETLDGGLNFQRVWQFKAPYQIINKS